ncbi:MAG: hypothetical protein IH945_06790 [Armatimonadetes bacterium]|nr:hypothetical protein [Armatimonadota bacterium]
MITAAILATMLGPQALSFEHPIDVAEVVLSALGQQVGETIRTSGALTGDRIYVRLKDTDWPTAKQMLAEGLRSEWRRQGGVQYLYREPAEPKSDDKQTVIDGLRKWQQVLKVEGDYSFQALLQRLDQRVPDQQFSEEDYAFDAVESYVWLNDPDDFSDELDGVLSPGVRALMRIVPLLDPQKVAELSDQAPTIASPNPQARDFRLPASSTTVLKQFWEERVTLEKALEVLVDDEYGNYFDGLAYQDVPLPTGQMPLVRIEVDETSVGLELLVLTGEGLVQVGRVHLYMKFPPPEARARKPHDFAFLDQPLKLTEEERVVMIKLDNRYGWYGEEPKLDERQEQVAIRVLMDPVKNDPLRLVCQPILEQAADARGMSMVALMTDLCIFHAHWADDDNVTVGQAATTLIGHGWNAESVEKDGYWLIYPRDLSILEPGELDRPRTKQYAEEVARTGVQSLEALLNLYRNVALPEAFDNSVSYLYAVHGRTNYYYSMDSTTLGFLAGLSNAQIQAARSPAGLVAYARQLPAKFQRSILQEVCSSYDQLSDGPFDPTSEEGRMYGKGYYSSSGYQEEGEERAPITTILALRSGMPNDVRVQLRIVYEMTLTPKPEEEFSPMIFGLGMNDESLEGYARSLGYYRSMDEEQRKNYVSRVDVLSVSVGFKETLYTIIEFPGLGYTYTSYNLPTGLLKPNYVSYDDLPKDIKAQVEAIIKKSRQPEPLGDGAEGT